MTDQSEIDPKTYFLVETQFLYNLYARLIYILQIYSEGYLIVSDDSINAIYIKIRRAINDTLQRESFESLRKIYPNEIIPTNLDSLGGDSDIYWEENKDELTKFKGSTIEFCVSNGADDYGGKG